MKFYLCEEQFECYNSLVAKNSGFGNSPLLLPFVVCEADEGASTGTDHSNGDKGFAKCADESAPSWAREGVCRQTSGHRWLRVVTSRGLFVCTAGVNPSSFSYPRAVRCFTLTFWMPASLQRVRRQSGTYNIACTWYSPREKLSMDVREQVLTPVLRVQVKMLKHHKVTPVIVLVRPSRALNIPSFSRLINSGLAGWGSIARERGNECGKIKET